MSSDLENLANGIGDRVRVLQLIINSKDRDSGVSTDFKVVLTNPINATILAYGLESCCIPKSSYNIDINNQEFAVTDSVADKLVSIPIGNYSSTTLAVELEAQLNALTPDTYTVTLVDGHFVIVSSFVGFVINPFPTPYPFLYVIGLNPNQITPSFMGTVTALNFYDLSGPKNLYIKIRQLSEYMRDTRNLSCNFKIDYGCPFGSIVYFSNESKYHQNYTTLQNHLIRPSEFDVQLLNEDGNLVNLNGLNWSLVLRFVTKDLY